MASVFLLYALFASVFVIAKTGLHYTQPFFFIGSRMLLAGTLLTLYQWGYRRERPQLTKEGLGKVFRLALFNIYLANVFEFWGLKYLTASKTCFLYSLSPFISALFSYWLFKERMSLKKWGGLFIGCVGFIPILLFPSSQEGQTGQFLFFSWAEASVMAAAVCSVYGWILLRQLVKDSGYSPLLANGLSMIIGGGAALLHSLATENWDPFPFTEFLPFLECALLLIVISNLISYNLYGFLLRKYSATFLSFAGFTTPVFSAFFGWLFLQETIAWPAYVSGSIVFFGLFIFYQEELKEGYLQPRVAPELA